MMPRKGKNETWCDHKLETEMAIKEDGVDYCYTCNLCKLMVHCIGCKKIYYSDKKLVIAQAI